MNNFDLVIFDCGGVLVDSERLTNTVFAEMLNELGLSVTLEDMFNKFVGNSMMKCLEIIKETLGKPAPKNFEEQYRAQTKLALESNLKPIKGIEMPSKRLKFHIVLRRAATMKKCGQP